jgi:hypothetical protein
VYTLGDTSNGSHLLNTKDLTKQHSANEDKIAYAYELNNKISLSRELSVNSFERILMQRILIRQQDRGMKRV